MRFVACLAVLALPLAALAVAAPAAAPAATEDPRASAIRLYDLGRYAEALAGFRALDAAGKADGSVLYRLAFCSGAAGDEAERTRVQQRAVEALEKETAAGGSIEAWFYLSNVYRNLGRTPDSTRVAAEAVSRLESGKWKTPSAGVDLFRAAKLYADGGRDDKAEEWYRKTIAALKPDAGLYPSYVRWAWRYLGDRALIRMDWESAAKAYSEVVAMPEPSAADCLRLAIAEVRSGHWQKAADAWRRAEQLDTAGGDDSRYGRQLALQAAAIGSLPSLAPAGRTWDRLSQEELETLMIEKAKVAREANPTPAEGAESSAAAPPAPDLPARLREAHRVFVAAGIEFTARGLPIREMAFQKGFAPLVFHPEQWEMKAPGE
jgi:tetratricopeptide (TPR) repeat protein